MNEAVREMTFEEEAALYEKEARELFAKENPGYEAPPINHTVRRGMRIIRKARDEIKWLSGSCNNRTNHSNTAQHGSNTDNALNGWISVEERLPEKEVPVLAIKDDRVWYCERWWRSGCWHSLTEDARDKYGEFWVVAPTHWMPLPEPPEEEV